MTDQPLINPQAQNQDQNQIYINTPLQNNTTSDEPYNSTDLIDKPQNPVSQPIQKPNYPPQNLSAPMVQPLYPPSQGVALPVQQDIPVNNYPPQIQNPNNTPLYAQPVVPVYQTQYQNYRDISEIPHKGIYQINENTFYISTGCCFKIFPFLFFLLELDHFIFLFLILIFGY